MSLTRGRCATIAGGRTGDAAQGGRMLAEELQGQAPWLLRVRGADRVQRVRAVNALVIC